MTMLEKVTRLRADALEEAMASPAFAMVRALDAAVVAAGGESLIPERRLEPLLAEATAKVAIAYDSGKKVPQGDAAYAALSKSGPLPIGRLLEKAKDHGAVFTGEKPLPSFRSMLSKDDRFYSLQRNNTFLWWLNGVDLPERFKPEPNDINDFLGSGTNTNQEGGDGHAANNTNLAS
jgi:hypothetical protein